MTKRESIELIMINYNPKLKSDNKAETALMVKKINTCKQDKLWRLTLNVPND